MFALICADDFLGDGRIKAGPDSSSFGTFLADTRLLYDNDPSSQGSDMLV